MNKFLQKVAKIFLGLSMAAGVGVAIGAGRNSASPAQADDGSVSKSASTLATENSWTQSSGSTIGTKFSSFDLDDYITVSFSGAGNTATYWTDVRVYGTKNKSDASVTFTGGTGVTIKTITLTFSTSNSPSFSPSITTGTALTVNSTSQTITMTSGSKNGQIRITNFACTYTYTPASTPLTGITLGGAATSNAMSIGSSDLTAKTVTVTLNPTTATDQQVNIAHQSGTTGLFTVSSSATCSSGSGSFTVAGKGSTSGSETFRISGNTETSVYVDLVVTALNDSITYYTVTYSTAVSSVSPTSEQVEANGHPSLPTPTALDHYTFNGWKLNGSLIDGTLVVTGDITLVADWTEDNKVTVTYVKGDHGTGSNYVVNDVYVGTYQLVTFATAGFTADTGYSFNKWSVGGTEYAENANITLSDNITVTAVYKTVDEYTLFSGALVAGDYIICSGTNAMKNTVTSSPRIEVATVTVTNNKIVDPDPSIVWHISVDSNDSEYWNIYNEAAEVYAAFTSTDGRGNLLSSVTDYARWQCSGTSSYEFTNKGKTGKYLRYNPSYGFASYSQSTGVSLTLYKLPENSFSVTTSTSGLTLSSNTVTAGGGQITLTTASKMKGSNIQVSNTATSSVNGNVVTLTNVTGNVEINATIGAATPTLSVSGQKTLFTLSDSWSFGGSVTATYDDWCEPHTSETLESGYTVDNSDFVAGVADTYTISISYTGAQTITYQVTVADLQEKTDVITLDAFDTTVSSYNNYTYSGSTTNTSYIGYLMANGANMQFKSNDSVSGIVTTNTKGFVKSVTVVWADNTSSGRELDVYGSNTAYTAVTELYGNNQVGTKVGSIVKDTSTTYTFTDDYEYIGLRSNSGAMYIVSISITWYVVPRAVHHIGASSVTAQGPFYVGTKPTLAELGVTVTAYFDANEEESEIVTSLATITYPANGLTDDNNGGDGYTISYSGKTTTVNITAEVGDVYAKLHSVTDLIVGSTVRITTTSYVMGTTANSSQLEGVEGDPTNSNLSGTANLTVGADKDGYYFYYTDSDTYYLTCDSDTAVLKLVTSPSSATNARWKVSINGTTGAATIENVGYSGRLVKSNSTTHRFACFTSGQDTVYLYQLVDADMTAEEEAAAQIDTFAKLYLHKLDILDNSTTRSSDTTTCNDYYDIAKAALSGDWAPIQQEFSSDNTGMWERYCAWAWATYREVPTFSNGVIVYNEARNLVSLFITKNTNTVAIIVIISMVSVTAIGGYFFLRKRKENI